MPAAAGQNLFHLSGKVAVVTGAGRGLGRAVAEGLAAFGAELVLAGRTKSTLIAAAEALQDRGLHARHFACDVTQEVEVKALRDFVLERIGRVDVLVNNAAVNPHYALPEETDLAMWRHIIDTNLTGVFLCCREFGRCMAERGGGSIINVSSVAGHVGLRKTVPYCAAKGGVEMMTRALAIDWAERGVRINCLAPGFFNTDLTKGMIAHPHISKRLLDHVLLGRFGEVHDLVGAAVFLAGPASAYMTGQSLLIDGGWTAH